MEQIASFMTLHILNLITPLTPSRHTPTSNSSHVNVRKVDITAPGLRSVLQAIVDASSATVGTSVDDHEEPAPEKDLFIKVSPPIYVRVFAPTTTSPKASGRTSISSSKVSILASSLRTQSTSEILDAFMSDWTRLVGDPIISKWIVLLLALSVALNGYLLKGIAAGVVGTRVTGLVGKASGVRFEEGADKEELEEKTTLVVPPVVAQEVVVQAVEVPRAPVAAAVVTKDTAAETATTVGTFTLEDVDRKLADAKKAARRLTVTPSSVKAKSTSTSISQPTPPYSSGESSSSVDESEEFAGLDTVRTLEECIDIFENGPRPLSASLALLNDEEVILLAQNGKIAAYALEKVLGMNHLERAVRIRRALICKLFLLLLLGGANSGCASPFFVDADFGVFRYPPG